MSRRESDHQQTKYFFGWQMTEYPRVSDTKKCIKGALYLQNDSAVFELPTSSSKPRSKVLVPNGQIYQCSMPHSCRVVSRCASSLRLPIILWTANPPFSRTRWEPTTRLCQKLHRPTWWLLWQDICSTECFDVRALAMLLFIFWIPT